MRVSACASTACRSRARGCAIFPASSRGRGARLTLAREHDVTFTWCGNLKPPSYVAWTLRARMGIPYGVMLHGTELLQMRAHGSGLRKRHYRAHAARLRRGDRHQQRVDAHRSHSSSSTQMKIPVTPDRVYAIPLGADLDRFRAGLDTAAGSREVRTEWRPLDADGRAGSSSTRGRIRRCARSRCFGSASRSFDMRSRGAECTATICARSRRSSESRIASTSSGRVDDADLPALYNVAEIYVGASRVAVDHVEGFGILARRGIGDIAAGDRGARGWHARGGRGGRDRAPRGSRTIPHRSPARSSVCCDRPELALRLGSAGTASGGEQVQLAASRDAICARSRIRTRGRRADEVARAPRDPRRHRAWVARGRAPGILAGAATGAAGTSLAARRASGRAARASGRRRRGSRSSRSRPSRRWTCWPRSGCAARSCARRRTSCTRTPATP